VSWQIPGDHVVAIPGEEPGHLPEGPGALPGPVDEYEDFLVAVFKIRWLIAVHFAFLVAGSVANVLWLARSGA
jgi:hypothetical protein